MMNIICADGRQLANTLFPHQATDQATKRRGVIVINSATGVPQGFYRHLALHLSHNGYDVLTWDARGIGASQSGHAKQETARMRDWGQLDMDAVLRSTVSTLAVPWEQVTVLGHSSGGHLAALAPALQHVPRLILLASGTCNWRLYPRGQWPRMLFAWHLLTPLFLHGLGYFPGKAGVGHDLPRGVAWDWRNWSLADDYLFSDKGIDTAGYTNYSGKIFSLSFADDHGFSPPGTVRDLLDHFPRAEKLHREIRPVEHGLKSIGHFGFFKRDNQGLWPLLDTWLSSEETVK
ncbi:alpha/beta hydrolase family protein [Undibacterium pigrum]|nr:alpha/beta fold hydrolase [Undibacterium pigrum]